MILRKPYAFLIKNFKLIHAIITVLMGYILIKTLNILSIFNDYFASQVALIGENAADSTYTFHIFFAPILIIILSIVLFWIMAVKKKPKTIYVFNIFVYMYTIVIFFLGKNVLLDMEINIIDVRYIKLIRDLTTFSFISQLFPIIKSLVRTVGFDIKQFDFGKDLAELEISEKDNEEFEINVSLDTNKLKRGLNFRKRNIRYALKENKQLVIIACIIFVLLIALIVTLTIISNNKIINMNSTFSISNFNIKVTNAYVTRKNYKSNDISNLNEKTSLIVVPFEVKNNSTTDKGFLTANIMLDIGNHRFRNTTTYRDNLYDIGTIYDGEMIKNKSLEYKMFVFEVPTSYLENKMYLRFITTIAVKGKNIIPKYISVPIKLDNLDSNNDSINIDDNEIDLNKTILGNTNFTINKIEYAKKFKIDYIYTIDKEKISSYEYLSAPMGNTDKYLLKVNYSINLDDKLNIKSFYEIIDNYGKLKYKIGDIIKTYDITSKVDPVKVKLTKDIYLVVPSEVQNATEVILSINIRGIEYNYKIK